MKIAITGHRPNKLGNDYALESPLIHAIRDAIAVIVRPYLTNTAIKPEFICFYGDRPRSAIYCSYSVLWTRAYMAL